MNNLPDIINYRSNPYHRLNVKHGIHHLYGFRRRYLLVNKFGVVCAEKTAMGLLNELLERQRREG